MFSNPHPWPTPAYPLTPPDDWDLLAWLVKHDASPHVLPSWPASSQIALVACVCDASALGEPAAYVIPTRAMANAAPVNSNLRILFFRIPKSVVLADGVRPDNLTPESWQ